jgi:hypothetical protein
MSDGNFRQERATELSRLATALRKSQLSCDIGELNSAASDCMESTGGGDTWGYSTERVIFNGPDEPDKIIPNDASLSKIALSVTLEGVCNEDDSTDPLNDLGVDIEIFAKGDGGNRLRSVWYMDRFESSLPRIKTPVHPKYHFQFGGIKSKNINTGEMVVASAPRLAHPPMDISLAIDFVLSNFFHDIWIDLRLNSGQYFNVVKKAQRLFWRPYVNASGEGWDRVSEIYPWQVVQVWPQLIPEDGIDDLHD